MKKFLNFFKVLLVLSLVLVVGFAPTTAKASDGIVGFSGETFLFYYKYGVETFLGNVSQGGSKSVVFNSVEFDQEDYNCLFTYVLEPVGPSDLIAPTRMAYGQTYEVRFSVGSKTSVRLHDDSARVYAFNPNYVVRTRVLCIYHDGSYGYLDYDLDWSQSGYSYTNFIVHLSGFEDKYVNQIYIYQWFNFNQAFGNAPLSSVNSMDLSMTAPTVLNETFVGPPIPDSPSYVLPEWDGEYNLDDLPSLDEFIPSGSNPFMLTLSKFTNLPVVVDMLLVVSVLGVLAYVVYGKRS